MYLNNQTSVVCPLFVSDDPEAETLATLCAEKLPAISLKRAQGHNTVFTASKWLSADVYRAIGRIAGCHIYEDEGDFVFANERYLTIHARTTGRKTLRLKRPTSPYEVYEEQYYGDNVDEFAFDMIRGETKMFKL